MLLHYKVEYLRLSSLQDEVELQQLTLSLIAQGIKAVIAESYERIHRSNLVGMGIIPLQFLDGQGAETLGLTGREIYSIELPENIQPGQTVTVKVRIFTDRCNCNCE